MSSDLKSIEDKAIKILTRAIEDEKNSKFESALVRYEEAIRLLLEVCNGCVEANKKEHYNKRIKEYISRAEDIKETVSKMGNTHTQVVIPENSTKHDYLSIFKPYLEKSVTTVDVEDAYIRNFHQICNFVRFCEMIVRHCDRIKLIRLTTTKDPNDSIAKEQQQHLLTLAKSLTDHDVSLQVTYLKSLHDRQIRLNTGWIIKIGRGLDYFKRVEKMCIGNFDMHLRPCHSTTVDIFNEKHVKNKWGRFFFLIALYIKNI